MPKTSKRSSKHAALSEPAPVDQGATVQVERTEDPTLARIGAFSDAVFAFAITLLILSIHIPLPSDAGADRGLLILLTEQWRSYLSVVISFMLIGLTWANHRVMFATFVRANHTLIWLNLLFLLLGVTFIPIPTAVLGAWLGNPNNGVIATVFYGGAVTVGSLAYNLVWWYGAYIAKLTSPSLTVGERRAHTLAWGPAPFVTAALMAVAFVSPSLAVVGYVIVIFVYILPVPRLVGLKQRRHQRSSPSGKAAP